MLASLVTCQASNECAVDGIRTVFMSLGHVKREAYPWCHAAQAGDKRVAADIRRVGQYGDGEALPNAQALAGRLLSTVYMGTANSSDATRSRASELAQQVPTPAASARTSSRTKCWMRALQAGGWVERGGIQQ